MKYNHILNLRHTRIDFSRLKLGVISITKTAHNQGANNESRKLYYKSYFARHFYTVLKLWVTVKIMCNIKSIGAFARLYCFLEICWNLLQFREEKKVFLSNFLTFPNFSKCKALEDFLTSFLEMVHLKGCLGGISQNLNFYNWFEILDIFRRWLLNITYLLVYILCSSPMRVLYFIFKTDGKTQQSEP